MLLIAAAFASCTEDFKNWASPQSNSPEDAITISGFTASAVAAQNLATTGDEVPVFSLNAASLPEGFETLSRMDRLSILMLVILRSISHPRLLTSHRITMS